MKDTDQSLLGLVILLHLILSTAILQVVLVSCNYLTDQWLFSTIIATLTAAS